MHPKPGVYQIAVIKCFTCNKFLDLINEYLHNEDYIAAQASSLGLANHIMDDHFR